ncbi:MAG TPA: trypsin-like serine protease [Solirubrobacteraceae bacterium]|nr:trypsin-like serine protease [Solirubrobacteraceae bacterium]
MFAPAAAFVAAATCCAPAGAVVGGKKAGTEGYPATGPLTYQVALIRNDRPQAAGQFCGGSVRNDAGGHPTHIVTAAHCVFDNSATAPGQPIDPGRLTVLAGTNVLTAGASHLRQVSAVSVDPAYDPATLSHDAAVLTLTAPIDGTGGHAIDFIADDPWVPPPGATAAVVSGWGRIDASNYPNDLRWAEMPFATDSSCQSSWADTGVDASTQVCAGRAGVDSCFGDSGGPLVTSVEVGLGVFDTELAGIVSYGDLDCDGSPPGVYTRVASPAIQDYISQDTPVSTPRNVSLPTVGGTAEVGQTITCGGGSWDNGPALDYQFVRGLDGRTTAALTNLGAQQSYVVTSTDAGSQLACFVKAHNGGGFAYSQSAWTAAVPAPPAQTPVPPTNQSPSQTQQDSAAPVARITKTTCTATRCTLNVTVTDVGFSAGIKTVQTTVRSTYRSTCKRKGSHKTVACTKHRTSKPSVAALTATQFKVVASQLPYGTQRFVLVAIDKAGHRQALPTTKTVTTKKPKKKHR